MKINMINPIAFTGTVKTDISDSHGNKIPPKNLYNIREYNTLASPDFLDLDIGIKKDKPLGYFTNSTDTYRVTLSQNMPKAKNPITESLVTNPLLKRMGQSAREAEIRQCFYDTLTSLLQKSIKFADDKNSSDKVNINILDKTGNIIPQEKLGILEEIQKLSNFYGLDILVKKSDNFTFAVKTKVPYMIYISKQLGEDVIKAEAPALIDNILNNAAIEEEIKHGIYRTFVRLIQEWVLKVKK